MAFDWRPIGPELMVVAFIVLLPLFSFFLVQTNRGRRDMGRITAIGLGGALAMTLLMMVRRTYEGVLVFDLYEVTPFTQFLKVVFLGVATLVALVSIDTTSEAKQPTEYYALLLVATLGMMVVASSRDLVTLFLGIETASLASAVLAGYQKGNARGAEASMKFFLVSALSSGLNLFAISLLYGAAGTVTFDGLRAILADGAEPIVLVGAVLAAAGLGFKITIVPFHNWAPDVYQGAPSPITAFLAGGSKKMGFAAVFKVFLVALVGIKVDWELALGLIAILTMTVGNVVAIAQKSIKRMLAYSSVAQAGYILIAVVVGTQFAVAGGLFHILTHSVMKAGAFLIVAAVAAWGIGDSVEHYRGLNRRSPLLAFTLAVLLLSLAGIPPLAGFASKFVLFSSAIDGAFDGGRVVNGGGLLLSLAIAGIVNSAISLYYYARIIRYVYVEEPVAGLPTDRIRLNPASYGAIVAVLVVVLAAGLYPKSVLDFAFRAAEWLVPAAGV